MNEAEGHTSQPAQTGGTAAAAPVAPAVQPAPAAPAGQPQNLFQVGAQFLLRLFFFIKARQLAQQQQQQPGARPGAAAAAAAGARAGDIDIGALRTHPQFQQLRQLVHTNPDLLAPLVQQIMEQNPHLGQLFESNPAALMQLLNGADDPEGDDGIPPGAQVIHITPEEQAAIGRVSSSMRILYEFPSLMFVELVGSAGVLAPESCGGVFGV